MAAWNRRERSETHSSHDGERSRSAIRLSSSNGWLPSHTLYSGVEVIIDGEIYERGDLVRALLSKNASEVSDAELVRHAYLEWGRDVLRRVKGVFAILIWDPERRVLIAARDPVGVYPLFYTIVGQRFYWATAVTPLLSLTGVSCEFNRAAIADYICGRAPFASETFIQTVQRVPPGSYLAVRSEGEQLHRYWQVVPDNVETMEWIDADGIDEFDVLFRQAIQRRQVDGHTGVFLSGGFDSVSVAAMARDHSAERGHAPPCALSLAFPHPDCDERASQQAVAKKLGLPQVMMPYDCAVGEDGIVEASLRMCAQWALPPLNPWRPAYSSLAKVAVDRGCKVILTGGGGDDWLAVAPEYMADLLRGGRLVKAYHFLRSMLRSYKIAPWAQARYLLWDAGIRRLITTPARGIVLGVAPGIVVRRWRRQLQDKTPSWLAPGEDLQKELDGRIEQRIEWQRARLTALGATGYYLSAVADNYQHPIHSIDQEENFEAACRLTIPIHEPYWDADLVAFLARVHPGELQRGGREKGLVRGYIAERFPDVGFEKLKKVTATNFFTQIVRSEGRRAWLMGKDFEGLSRLGVVDSVAVGERFGDWLSIEDPRTAFVCWTLLTLEAWLRPRVTHDTVVR